MLMSLALALIAQQWVATGLGAVAAVAYYISTVYEEDSCIEKFGDSYRR
jgi:protein-S-isoprenylcysteine O-methyltransferase Ste14